MHREGRGFESPYLHFVIMFSVYVLVSESRNRYYTGCTDDIIRRLAEHNNGKSKATRGYRPWRVVYSESFSSLSDARRREREIKSWKSREYMERKLGLAVQ